MEKRKAGPTLRAETRFYPEMLGYLLKYVVGRFDLLQIREIIIVTDQLPVKRKRQAVEKAIKQTLAHLLPPAVRHRIVHHASKSNMDLQIVDYCNWAIYRKWDQQDLRSYRQIYSAIHSEFDIFASGSTRYY